MDYLKLRSGRTIRKEVYCFSKKTTKVPALKTGRKHKEPVFAAAPQQAAIARLASDTPGFYREHITSGRGFSAFLSTYDDQFIKIVQEEGQYVMYVEDLMKDQKKDKMLLHPYDSQHPSNEEGFSRDMNKLMVSLSPMENFWMCANKTKRSVELQKYETGLPEQAYFVLQWESEDCVLFECNSNGGTYMGVKNNLITLIETEDRSCKDIRFKLSFEM
ncbi:interleukin-33 isoform X2 [Tupaia chinensis]|nr:interleukin-33 isoform X2 [Tupaia chinensis]